MVSIVSICEIVDRLMTLMSAVCYGLPISEFNNVWKYKHLYNVNKKGVARPYHVFKESDWSQTLNNLWSFFANYSKVPVKRLTAVQMATPRED